MLHKDGTFSCIVILCLLALFCCFDLLKVCNLFFLISELKILSLGRIYSRYYFGNVCVFHFLHKTNFVLFFTIFLFIGRDLFLFYLTNGGHLLFVKAVKSP